ncbi:hypothetical protein HMPREF9123_0597 [Neisseria bacilliformis ATCC BAA-1200]|uniref:Uncharacterized protein n=1 Tax=Neisseria bacilliformis ATCC BAA-1200 TaxID=888742 RepID=F2BA43_9NEIS|nr:hypothetical protein HMPREF9123_0597 [Neisseria bacilliformis ATCC BAA-1200]
MWRKPRTRIRLFIAKRPSESAASTKLKQGFGAAKNKTRFSDGLLPLCRLYGASHARGLCFLPSGRLQSLQNLGHFQTPSFPPARE